MPVRFDDQVVVVTGASKGIGAAIARQFGAAGARVVVNYASSKSAANAVAAAITAARGEAMAVQGDVAKEDDVKRLFAGVKQRFGRLDVLVNNAGVFSFGPLEQVTAAEFHRQFSVNVLGLLLASREALPLFGGQGGSIINIGSSASTYTPPNASIYVGTKGAVNSITRSLAKELGPRGIRVNAVNPGPVDSEGARAADLSTPDSAIRRQQEAMSPLGRIGQPDDIAGTVLYLASPQAGWVTGELWAVAGGIR